MSDSSSIDISGIPELERIVSEAARSEQPVFLRRGERIVARVTAVVPPAERPIKERTPEGFKAFRSSAGSWKDVDVDQFLADNYESRNLSPRPPVDL